MSVRHDFCRTQEASAQEHNLIYTLDHSPKCGDINDEWRTVRAARRGRSQWVIDEGLRREGYFCGAHSSTGSTGDPRRSLARAAHSGAPRMLLTLQADRTSGSVDDCARPKSLLRCRQWLMLRIAAVSADVSEHHRVLDQYAFMRQWGQHAGMTMQSQQANGLQTWWHQLLQGKEDGATKMETVAIVQAVQRAAGTAGAGDTQDGQATGTTILLR